MRRIVTGLLLSAFVCGTSAWADDTNNYGVNPGPNDTFSSSNAGTQQPGMSANSNAPITGNNDLSNGSYNNNQQPGTAAPMNSGNDRYDDTTMSSTASKGDVTRGALSNGVVAFQPQVGAMAIKDSFGNNTSRGALGLTADMNLASAISKDLGHFFIGPATGAIYSHIGSPGSNFVGTSPDNPGVSDGANLLLLPANLKLGYALTDNFRISARGGGNVIYRSVGNSLNLGSSSAALGSDSGWRIFPNVGGDVEIGFGQNVSLMLRPDVTFTPGDNIYTGTIGLGLNLG
jgi:hypothetical protein